MSDNEGNGEENVVWSGTLRLRGRSGEAAEARLVKAEGAMLDKFYKVGAGLRLERRVTTESGGHWEPLSAYEVNSVALVVALAHSAETVLAFAEARRGS